MAFYRDLLCTFCALLAAFTGLIDGQSDRTGSGCTDTRQAYREKGFSANDVPPNVITGDHLRVCPAGHSGFTCCTVNMESQLTQTSSAEFENIVYEKSSLLRDYFFRRTERFDNYMKTLIDNSQRDLHEMFVLTYGPLYEQNRAIFDDLFTTFRNYYYGVDLDLAQVMDDFFETLFQRMFQLLSPQYRYSDEFWECTMPYLDILKPFGIVPENLRLRAKRSFVAARTFVQGLGIGRDVVTRGTKVEPTPECRKALMRMSYCSHCKGIPSVKPCNSLCLNVMKGCLASQAELDGEWNYFIDAMTMLGGRMEGILNIETFMTTLDIEISNAIMNMQNNGMSITTKVFNGCGTPRQSRIQKREANTPEDEEDPDPTDPADPTETTPGEGEEAATEKVEEEAATEKTEEGAADTPPDAPPAAPQTEEETSNTPGLLGRQGRRDREGRQRSNGYASTDQAASSPSGSTLDRLIKDVLKRLRDYRPFWGVLPYMICEDTTIAEDVTVSDNCWNGQTVGRYVPEIVGNGLSSQPNNPEMLVDNSRPVVSVRLQITSLRVVTRQLQYAYQGEDVVWIDTVESDASGSGSGSGSGDGNNGLDNNNLFPFSTDFEDPLYRPTKSAPTGSSTSTWGHRSLLVYAVAILVTCLLRW